MAEKFYNYPGYIEVVGFESMRDQVEDAAQKVIAENNAVDAAQSEKIAQNTESINSEVERSKSADAEFENDLALEIDERKRMGGILNTKISDEASIRESADKALEVALNDLNKHVSEGFDAVNDAIEINEQHISAVKEHVEKVHNELSDKLAIEESTRQIKDEELSKVIAEEASIREQNDQAIRELIDDQKMSRDAIISEMKEEVAKAIAEEASVRENNDQAIRDLVDDQKASRIAADEELSKSIAEEASIRENNDQSIRELIDDQKTSRDAIVAELKVVDEDLARLIKEEASAREEKDNELSNKISEEIITRENGDLAIRDLIDDQKASRDAIVAELKVVDEDLARLIKEEASAREEVVAELKVVDEDLARLIKEEASAREEGDFALKKNLNTVNTAIGVFNQEITTLKEKDIELSSSIVSEIAAREEGDASLKKNLNTVNTAIGVFNQEITTLKEKDIELVNLISVLSKELESLRKEIEPLKVSNNSMIAIKEINSLKEGEVLNLSLDTDLVLDERIEIAKGASVNINLNGKTIKSNIDDIIFRVDGNLVIEGEGKIETVGYGASANEGSTVLIKNGSHKCSTTCYQSNGGILTIEGGFFNAYNEQYNGKYTINFIDKMYKDGIGDIIVNGGTFVGYNPMNSESEFPAATFVQEGYHVEEVVVDGISQFTVVKD